MATALKYFTVFFLSGLKFVFGPAFGVANDLPIIATILLSACGMMATIYLFTFFGSEIRGFAMRFKKNPKIFTKRNRRFVKIWRTFGLEGVCLLTPLILTPPGGGLLANLLGTNRKKLIKWMWISALGWSTLITLIIKYAFWLVEGLV